MFVGNWTSASRILLLGLESAGKTTILYKLKYNNKPPTNSHTVVFNVEDVQVDGFIFNVWDLGGQAKVRELWRHHYDNIDGIIFVVDSADLKEIQEAATELQNVMESEAVRGLPVVVFANKMDLPTAMQPSQLVDVLRLRNLHTSKWFVQESNAISGHGLAEGFQQMAHMVKEKKGHYYYT